MSQNQANPRISLCPTSRQLPRLKKTKIKIRKSKVLQRRRKAQSWQTSSSKSLNSYSSNDNNNRKNLGNNKKRKEGYRKLRISHLRIKISLIPCLNMPKKRDKNTSTKMVRKSKKPRGKEILSMAMISRKVSNKYKNLERRK